MWEPLDVSVLSFFAMNWGFVMKRLAAALLVTVLLIGAMSAMWGCTTQDTPEPEAPATSEETAPTELRVSAALTLKKAFEQLAPEFEDANNVKLVYNFGTMGVLQKQVEGGAPADVFASASPKPVEALVAAGLASGEATEAFAQNVLVIVVPVGNPAGITGPADLAKAKRIVTGDPVTTPHGTAAKLWLEKAGLADEIQPKLIFADTLDHVATGEVDAGIVFVSSAKSNPKVEIAYTVAATEIKPSTYVATTVTASQEQGLAAMFIEYLLSSDAQAVLVENGFLPAP